MHDEEGLYDRSWGEIQETLDRVHEGPRTWTDTPGGGTSQGGPSGASFSMPSRPKFFARITGQAPDDGGSFSGMRDRYSWIELSRDGSGLISDKEGGLFGTYDGDGCGYAQELNGNTLVPVGLPSDGVNDSSGGAIVEITQSDNGTTWDFAYCCDAGTGTYTETQWTTDTHNYDPPDNYSTIEVSSSTTVTLTGMDLEEGRTITLVNVGEQNILIPHENSGSDETSRFVLPNSGSTSSMLVLIPNATATFVQNPTTDRVDLLDSSMLVTQPVQTETINANTNNLAVDPGAESVLFTLNGDYNLTGLTGGYPGRSLTLTNSEDSTGTFTLIDGSGSSSAGNQLDTLSNLSIPLTPGKTIRITYTGNAGSGLWTVVEPPLTGWPYAPTGLTGSYNDYDIPANTSMFVPALSGDTTFTSFDVAGVDVGTTFLVVNSRSNSNTITLTHDSGAGTAGNRLDMSTATSVVLDPGESSLLVYDGSRYLDASISLGASIGSTVQAQDALLQDIADLTDPGADRIAFWDDSAGHIVWLEAGSGLSISGTTITASGTTNANGEDTGSGSLTTTFANIGATVTLADTGTYLLTAQVTGSGTSDGDATTITARLYNSTDAAAVGTEGVVVYMAASAYNQGSVTIVALITTAGTNRAIDIQAKHSDTTGTPTMNIDSSRLTYVRLA